jgi:phosphate-selective porin OprO/OprP
MKKYLFIFTVLFSLSGATIMAQKMTVTGKVTSSELNQPIVGVQVRLQGAQTTFAESDANGLYKIIIDQNSTKTLLFQHPDFDEREVFVDTIPLDIVLTSNVRYNQYGVKVNRNPLYAEERNGVLVFESPKNNYRMWFDMRVQADGNVFFGEPINPIGNGVSIRRARFAGKVEFAHNWYAEIDLDFSNSNLELKDAYLLYHFNNGIELKAGNFKEGFSMEATTTSRYLTFIERPNSVSAFAPSRHIGFAGNFNHKWLTGIAGIHFQDIGGLEERVISEDNNKNFGTDEGVSFTGKLVAIPYYKDHTKGLHFGVSGSYRTPKTDADLPGALRYSTRSLSSINRKKYLDTDNITSVHHSTLTGFELAGYYKNLRLQGEYMMSSINRKDDLATEEFNGFYAMGSWLIFGGNYQYNVEEAEFTQVVRGKKWGDLEMALRYDYIDLNSEKGAIMGGSGEGYTVGLNYYVNNSVKFMLNYSYMNHDRYANGKGKLYTGYDVDGNLTSDGKLVVAPNGEAGDDFGFLGIRIEVDF